MKVRNGFVSNSSSSSFIATYGKIEDAERFESWINSCPYAKEYKVMKGSMILEEQNAHKWCVPVHSGFIDGMINNNKVLEVIKSNPDSMFIYKTGTGPNSDSEFMTSDDDDDFGLDYDIDLDRFDMDDIELYNSSVEYNGVKVIDQTYYAGRNG